MAFFFLEYLFSFQRYLHFCEESGNVIGGLTKTLQHSIKKTPEMYITQEAKYL